jgi:Gametolysin peptidase M11
LDYDHSEGEERDQIFRCLTEGDQEPDGLEDMTYTLKLSREFVEAHSYLENGNTYVVIQSGRAIRENEDGAALIYYPNATEIVLIPPTRRHLGIAERRQGVKSLLVLRVTALDGKLSLSQEELSARTFGIGDNAPVVNVRSQYNSCSFGKFKIIPATGEGITDGVANVQIDNVVGKDPFNLENQVVAVAEKTLGRLESRFDHVMICLPPGTLYQGVRSKWYAYGYRNWYRTVYNNEWCGYYSAPMHEIGHNLNLQHSSEGSTLYGDQTGTSLSREHAKYCQPVIISFTF